MKPILEIRNISKSYQIGAKQERYLSLRDSMVNFFKKRGQKKEEFWALQDLSFDVYPGDTLGIIGRNGAGKSTLLKILSRITPPTKGHVKVRGTMSSLLEVGTGFHPELTGRENIFLNGAILGLLKSDIQKQFDAIVDFSGVEQFLDTPLKHFSSGMQLRLAFAVAAHLEPDILVIDEVLAVGDAEFQKKCLNKMGDITKNGRTLLFVSHNLAVVKDLCSRVILINEGQKIEEENASIVIEKYLESGVKQAISFPHKSKDIPHFSTIQLKKESISYNENLHVDFEIYSPQAMEVAIEIEIRDTLNTPLSYSSTSPMQGQLIPIYPHKKNAFSIEISELRLAAGDYNLFFWLIYPWKECFDFSEKPLRFSILFADPFSTGFDFKQSYNRGVFHHRLNVTNMNNGKESQG